ncbi:MAG TPA: response regulator transcription factor [Ktedonobacterales bacterium]|jgi:DNA-binding response OmpR family regulator
MATILIVEDEVDLCHLLRSHLEAEGHTVYQAFDGPSALDLVEAHTPQLLILDWMLPGMDGLTVCRKVRQRHLMPILMLTARSEEVDRVLGLEVGADDYVVKPFSMRELLARTRAILRRVALDSQAALTPDPAKYENPGFANAQDAPLPMPAPVLYGPLSLDAAQHTAALDGIPLDLTPREFDLLLLFASHPGRVFSRQFLLERLWGYEYDGQDRAVDTQVTRLRKKLGPLSDKLVTVWGVGYRLVP